MAAKILVFPIERHSYLGAIARRIVEEHPFEERDMAIVKEARDFRNRQCRRFPQAIAFQQWLNMIGGLAGHVGEIEGSLDAA
jgi:hypothetical protein